MKAFAVKAVWLLASLTVLVIVPVGAQSTVQETPDAAQEAVEAASDAQRVRRIREVIEFDRARLEQARSNLPQRQALFDQLAEAMETWKADQQAKRLQLEQTSDPEKRESLENEIAKLDDELELLRAQSELAFSSLTTVRQQIPNLEKKIEREQRTLDVLLGVATVTAPPAGAPADDQPAGAPADDQSGVITAPAGELMVPVRSTAQIEATRELERMQREAAEAEQRLIEFVKRKRSLEQQIALEAKLLDTARESEVSLPRLLETRRTDLEQVRAVDPNGEDALRYQRGIAFLERLLARVQDEIDDRAAYLDSLNERLEKLAMEEQAVTRNAENAHELVVDARARLNRLESPLHPQNLAHWARERGPRILILLGTLAGLLVFVRFGIRALVRLLLVRKDTGADSGSDRADTLAFSFRSAMTFFIVTVGVFLLLEEAGVDVRTVLGGAAIVGVAVAFGAQNLMRDYFTGFVILLEKQFELGDLVTIAGVTGVVESVNMRATMLRDLEGRVHFIPNGEIKSVTNRTYHWGRAMVEIPIGYQEKVDRVMETLAEVAKEVRKDPKYSERITEDPIMLGVDEFAQEGVIIKLMMKTVPEDVTAIRRELLRRIKNRFDEVGIGIRGEEPPQKEAAVSDL